MRVVGLLLLVGAACAPIQPTPLRYTTKWGRCEAYATEALAGFKGVTPLSESHGSGYHTLRFEQPLPNGGRRRTFLSFTETRYGCTPTKQVLDSTA